jgi:hypothetical protein
MGGSWNPDGLGPRPVAASAAFTDNSSDSSASARAASWVKRKQIQFLRNTVVSNLMATGLLLLLVLLRWSAHAWARGGQPEEVGEGYEGLVTLLWNAAVGSILIMVPMTGGVFGACYFAFR